MNASPPIQYRWSSLLIALAIISSSLTLAEDTDDRIIQQQRQQQQRNVAAANDVVAQNEDNLAKLISSRDSNNEPSYPQRPNSNIQIDLEEYLSIIMDNTTSSLTEHTMLTEKKEEEDNIVVETLPEPPKNPAVNQLPEKRFSLWSELTKHEQDTTSRLLHYNENTWDNPMTNPVEMLSFNELTIKMKSGLSVLRITQPEWDCHVNHYYGYTWDELMKVGVHVHLAMLGWTKESWEFGNVTKPDIEWMMWEELSERQKLIARELCYFNEETWDEWPLSMWLVEWRKMKERKGSTTTTSTTMTSSSPKVVQ